MVRRTVRTRIAGVVLLAGWVLMPGFFAFAQTATSSAELSQLVTKLQAEITALQTQVAGLKSQLTATQAELKFTRALRRGASGDEVKELQEFLKQFPDIYPEGLVTGFFGPRTEAAVKRLQEQQGIEAEGIVGPKTRAKLNELATEGAGASGLIPPGLLTAPGLQREGATGTSPVPVPISPPPAPTPPPLPGATTTPPVPTPLPPPATATTTPAQACAKTLNVPSEKYPTIQSALDAACRGDVVRIAAGTYSGVFSLTARHSSITITGAGLDQTVIQGVGAPGFTLASTSDIAIKNLTIIRAGHPSTDGGGIRILRSKNITLEHCRISKSFGNEGGALALDDSSAVTVTRCLFDANISTHSAGGIIVKQNSQATLTNITVASNEARGCHGGGLVVDGTSTASVKNAIFWANSDTSPPGTPCQRAPSIYGTPTVTYSDVERGFTGSGNINLNPYFVSLSGGDYHILTPNSPVVNAGDPATIDPDGTRADMGVFPYGTATLVPVPVPAPIPPPPAPAPTPTPPPPASATSTPPAPTPTPATATTTLATPPPPPPTTTLPAPTYIRADWGYTLGPWNKRNGTASQTIVFKYPNDSSAKTTTFRLYQKTPTDSSFMRAAEFTGIDSTTCNGKSVVGEWILVRPAACASWVVGRVKVGATELSLYDGSEASSFPASSYVVGEYSYYVTAVNSTGAEGALSATSKLVFFELGTILAPTTAQSPVSQTPTFQWTVGSGWPSFITNSYYINIFDSASPPGTFPLVTICAPAGCRGSVIPGGVNSQIYNGPALDPTKKYRLSIYGLGLGEALSDGGLQYLALPRAVTDFWVQSATTAPPPPPSGPPSVTILAPNGGEAWTAGQSYAIRWRAENIPADTKLGLQLSYRYSGNTAPYEDGIGAYYGGSANADPAAGTYQWTVPAQYGSGYDPSMFKVRAYLYGPNIPGTNPPTDYSDTSFTIRAPVSATTTSAAAPSGIAAVLESLAQVVANLNRLLEGLRR